MEEGMVGRSRARLGVFLVGAVLASACKDLLPERKPAITGDSAIPPLPAPVPPAQRAPRPASDASLENESKGFDQIRRSLRHRLRAHRLPPRRRERDPVLVGQARWLGRQRNSRRDQGQGLRGLRGTRGTPAGYPEVPSSLSRGRDRLRRPGAASTTGGGSAIQF